VKTCPACTQELPNQKRSRQCADCLKLIVGMIAGSLTVPPSTIKTATTPQDYQNP
jgi:hypothetical protein